MTSPNTAPGPAAPDPGPQWIKSSRSFSNGNCVEVAWAKSSASNGTNCLEAASCACGVLVRDSKDRGGPVLSFTSAEWQAFLDGAKNGEFDPPGRSLTVQPQTCNAI